METWRNLSSSGPDLNCLLVCLAGLKLPVLFKVWFTKLAFFAREPVQGFHKNTILNNQFILLQFVILINEIELVQFFISFSFL